MAGVLYVLEGLASVSGQLVIPGQLVVAGDAAATAARILENEPLFRLGLALGLVAVALHTVLTVLLYDLLRPSGRLAALLLAFVGFLAIVVQAASSLFQLPALIVLEAGPGAGGFGAEGPHSFSLLFMRWSAQAFNAYLALFGIRCAILGHLVFRSRFLPRFIGVLLGFTALGYLTFLWPPLAKGLHPFNLALAGPGELSFIFWLLVVGVNAERWSEQARE